MAKSLFYSRAKGSLSNFNASLYPESFILCEKAVYNGLTLEVYTSEDNSNNIEDIYSIKAY